MIEKIHNRERREGEGNNSESKVPFRFGLAR